MNDRFRKIYHVLKLTEAGEYMTTIQWKNKMQSGGVDTTKTTNDAIATSLRHAVQRDTTRVHKRHGSTNSTDNDDETSQHRTTKAHKQQYTIEEHRDWYETPVASATTSSSINEQAGHEQAQATSHKQIRVQSTNSSKKIIVQSRTQERETEREIKQQGDLKYEKDNRAKVAQTAKENTVTTQRHEAKRPNNDNSTINATTPSTSRQTRHCNEKHTTTKYRHDKTNVRQRPKHNGYTQRRTTKSTNKIIENQSTMKQSKVFKQNATHIKTQTNTSGHKQRTSANKDTQDPQHTPDKNNNSNILSQQERTNS